MSQGNERLELADPDAYTQLLINRVGDRSPLDVAAETPAALASFVAEHDVDVLRRRPSPDKWSAIEVLGHLVDTEWVFGQRTRAIACDDRPQIIGIDQDRWVATLGHQERDPHELVEEFRSLRTINLAQWRRFDEALFDRVGRHNERGEESLATVRSLVAGHDLHHLAQLQAIVAAT